MKNRNRPSLGTIGILGVVSMLLLVVIACASQENEATALLQDSKFGLSHLNDEFHAIKGEELLSNPKFGLAHLNDEFHAIKGEELLANPKFGLAHLNDEFHNIKESLADISQQLESIQQAMPPR